MPLTKALDTWRGKRPRKIPFTEEKEKRFFNQGLTVQMLLADNPSLFLALSVMDEPKNYSEIKSIMEPYHDERSCGWAGRKIEELVSSSLDTLLDFGIFKDSWNRRGNRYVKEYRNRGEFFDFFKPYQERLTERIEIPPPIDFSKPHQKRSIDYSFEVPIEMSKRIYHLRSDTPEDVKEYFKKEGWENFYENRINLVERDFISFLKEEVLGPGEEEVLIPSMAKGYAIFQEMGKNEEIEEILDEKGIDIEYGIPGEPENRKFCIVDDVVGRNKDTVNYIERLKERDVPPENIRLSSFLSNKDVLNSEIGEKISKTLGEDNITIHQRLPYNDLNKEESNLLFYIASLGSIVNRDHLFMNADLGNKVSGSVVMETLENLNMGEIFEPGSKLQYLYPNKKKITIDGVDYEEVTGKNPPSAVEKIDQCKVRTNWGYNPEEFEVHDVTIMPVVDPKISIPRHLKDHNNKEKYRASILHEMYNNLLEGFSRSLSKELPGGLKNIDIRCPV